MYELKLNKEEHFKFVNVMKDRCEEEHITLEELANRLDVSPRSVYNFVGDSSRQPSRFLAAKIADELKIKAKDFKVKGAFFLFALSIATILLIPNQVKAEPKDIDFDKYIEKTDVLDEVLGIDYGTDFIPGYYEDEVIIDENIPFTEREQAEIQKICEEHNVCYELVLSIIETESAYQLDATNGNCKGVMQINTKCHEIENPYDLLENVEVGVNYLEALYQEYEDTSLVLMAYNGEPRAEQLYADGYVTSYAKKIMGRSEELEREHNK